MSAFQGQSMSGGVSANVGRSAFNSNLGDVIFNESFRITSTVFDYYFKESIGLIQEVFGREGPLWKQSGTQFNHEAFIEQCKTAKKHMEAEQTKEAVAAIKTAIDDLRKEAKESQNPDLLEACTKIDGILSKTRSQMIDGDIKEGIKSLKKSTDEMSKSNDPDVRAAGKNLERIIDEAAKRAKKNNEPLEIYRIECQNQNLDDLVQELSNMGIQAQAFYGENGKDEETGEIFIPYLSAAEKDRVMGATILSNIKNGIGFDLTPGEFDLLAAVTPPDDRAVMTGLSKEQVEVIRETMVSQKVPISINEKDRDGNYSVVFRQRDQKLLSERFLQNEIARFGYGEQYGHSRVLNRNAGTLAKAEELITNIADGKDTFGYVIDAADPKHFIRITEKGATEIKINDKGKEEIKDSISFEKTNGAISPERQLKSKIISISSRSGTVFVSPEKAKTLKITKSEYPKSEEALNRIKKAANAKLDMTHYADYKNSLAFTRAAVQQAAKECRGDYLMEDMMVYIADHPYELVERYYYERKKEIEKKHLNTYKGKDLESAAAERQKNLDDLEKLYNKLKDKGENSIDIEEWLSKAKDEILGTADERGIRIETYQPERFSAEKVDNFTISQQEISQIKKAIDMAVRASQLPVDHEDIRKNVQETAKILGREADPEEYANAFESQVDQYKAAMMKQNPKVKEGQAQALAYAQAVTVNLKETIKDGKDLIPENKYSRMYGVNQEEVLMNVDEAIHKEYGFHLEDLYDKDKISKMGPSKQKYADIALKAADKELPKEVVRQMQNGRTKDPREENKEDR